MDRNTLKSILIEQKQEQNKALSQKIIKREKIVSKKLLESSLIKVITGVRRCGKSTLSHQVLEGKNYGYANFDDERLAGIGPGELNNILETILSINDSKPQYLLFDEIQNVPAWELFVNRLQRQGYNLIITGSNSKLLSKELATHLTGRHMPIELFPFSFQEFLSYKNFRFEETDFYITEKRARIKKELEKYFALGGFPEALEIQPRGQYLRELHQKIVTQDIVSRYGIRHSKTLKELALYVLSNLSSKTTYHKLKNIFEIKSVHTIKNYLEYLEEAYLIFQIKPFSFKAKEQLRSPKKIYSVDHAMAKSVSLQSSPDMGKMIENIVFVELKRREKEIYYFSDYQGYEVDFLIRKGIKISQMIQVCLSLSDPETKKRELRALLRANSQHNCNDLLVITLDEEGKERIKGKTINFIPLWKWLLKK